MSISVKPATRYLSDRAPVSIPKYVSPHLAGPLALSNADSLTGKLEILSSTGMDPNRAKEIEDAHLMKDGMRIAINDNYQQGYEYARLGNNMWLQANNSPARLGKLTEYFLCFDAVPNLVADVFDEAIKNGHEFTVAQLLASTRIQDMMKGTIYENKEIAKTTYEDGEIMKVPSAIESTAISIKTALTRSLAFIGLSAVLSTIFATNPYSPVIICGSWLASELYRIGIGMHLKSISPALALEDAHSRWFGGNSLRGKLLGETKAQFVGTQNPPKPEKLD